MQFYHRLITVLFPFVVLNPKGGDNPPENTKFVINYLGQQVVTYNAYDVIAKQG